MRTWAEAALAAAGLVGGAALAVFALLAAWEWGGLAGLVGLTLAAVVFWRWWLR